MPISYITFLAFQLNGLLDTGEYANIDIKTVAREIEDGTIFNFLETRFKGILDLSILDTARRQELVEEWQSLLNAVDHRRKFCVEKNGIALLVAYCLEGIQRRARAAQL